MKQALLICIMLLTPLYGQYRKTTIEVAERLGYPHFINRLRVGAENFLAQLRVSMMVDVQSLRSKDLNYRADELNELDNESYDALSERLDTTFDQLSRKLNITADRLDNENAPEKEKAQFIAQLKREAEEAINSLLEQRESKKKK